MYGAEVMLLNLIEEQIKLGLEPTIASISEKNIQDKPIETEAEKRNFSIKKFKMIPGPNIAGALKILRFAHKEGFNLLHTHGYKGNVLFGLMPKAIRQLPLLATLHGYTSTKGLSKNKFYEWADYISHKFIDTVVLVNKGMMNNPKLKNRKGVNYNIINNGIPVHNKQFKDSTIYLPIQTIQKAQLYRTIKDFCNKGFTIGTIGRLSAEKGYDTLIVAISILRKKGINARLIIIGEGGQRNYLENITSQHELSNHILMPGYIQDAKHYIPFFNVYVNSSLTEGLPITLLEVMQAKVPIIATKVGGIPNVLRDGDAGLLVFPCKPYSLANAIMRIYHNKDLAEKMIQKAYNRVSAHYSSKIMASKYLNIYKELI